MSGTSMSCPHVTGITTLIHAAHPDWTPAAIKSSLMTSFALFDNTKLLIQYSFTNLPTNAFAMGTGHVNPSAALNSGLIYDAKFDNYVSFLCSLNYTRSQIHILTRMTSFCTNLHSEQPGDLNCPSFSVVFKSRNLVRVARRSVINVGGALFVYEMAIESPPNININMEPRTLTFKKKNEKVGFTVIFERKIASDKKSSGHHEFG